MSVISSLNKRIVIFRKPNINKKAWQNCQAFLVGMTELTVITYIIINQKVTLIFSKQVTE
jgi:hypothetical protein